MKLHPLHFTLHTLHCTPYFPHFTLHISHSTILTSNSRRYIPYSTLHYLQTALHSIFHSLHWCGHKGRLHMTIEINCFTKLFYLTALGFGGWSRFSKQFCRNKHHQTTNSSHTAPSPHLPSPFSVPASFRPLPPGLKFDSQTARTMSAPNTFLHNWCDPLTGSWQRVTHVSSSSTAV